MNPLEVIAKIHQSGGSVWGVNGSLHIDCAPQLITLEERQALADHGSEMARLLARPEGDPEREAIASEELVTQEQTEVVREALGEIMELSRTCEHTFQDRADVHGREGWVTTRCIHCGKVQGHRRATCERRSRKERKTGTGVDTWQLAAAMKRDQRNLPPGESLF